ncbi:pyruvate synthase subunit beta [Candidatus Bathyarchaeota archaeon]|nr:MAG: pyruvate synthase subunit beta [Candidatus Bathyarchaeota archaeon]
MVTLKQLPVEELWGPGHNACAGCGPSIAVKMILKALRGPTVVVSPTGCMEVVSSSYPQTAWGVPWVHVLFENAAAVASGIEAAYKYMVKKGITNEKPDVIVIAGDGGTFDIGLQALSGALERWHDFLYICYDNEAYMNTGIQRSSATPRGAWTTTSPAGKVIPGKPEWKKDLIGIAVAHGIPYAATATIAYWNDLITKVRKALEVEGPTVLHVLAPCPLGWRFDPSKTVEISRLAVQTRYFPLYEVENGVYKLSVKVSRPKPVEEFLKPQRRFRHLFTPENRHIIEEIQKNIDEGWERLLKRCGLKS